jgi:hypothetical protein
MVQRRLADLLEAARVGASIGTAACGSALAMMLATALVGDLPLPARALLATLGFWGTLKVLQVEEVAFLRQYGAAPGMLSSTAFVVAILGLSVVERSGARLGAFYCNPTTLRSLVLAMAGAAVFALLSRLASERAPTARLSLLIHLSLVWCAPFLGFFMGPVFLAGGLAASCSADVLGGVLATAVGMTVSGRLGMSLAGWIDRR